ncbi:MAG TPA: CARDB domain-containing protein [Solirubrobacterales bacterium]|nr:CARDB domain-containing protein [Solirubrobacterales bacterium]
MLLVLGVKGCLNARQERALTDYANDVTQIVDETQQTSESFFGKLDDPGSLSVTEFVGQVDSDRSAMESYASRVDSLDAPGDMAHAQNALELVYELRVAAMNDIADQMSTALGDVGSERAMAIVADRMRMLLGSDVLYAAVVRPEIDGVLADNGIEGNDVPKSIFVPDETWLDPDTVSSALGSVSGATGGATSGVHGLGLFASSIDGVPLTADSTTTISADGTPEVEVQVQNQGDSTENGVTVSVSVDGSVLEQDISSIAPLETQSVTIPLTPAPSGQVTLDVSVQPVPGELVSSNNEASYIVLFQ